MKDKKAKEISVELSKKEKILESLMEEYLDDWQIEEIKWASDFGGTHLELWAHYLEAPELRRALPHTVEGYRTVIVSRMPREEGEEDAAWP